MPPAYALALALAITAPLLAPGYLLFRDAVSTPRSYLSDAALGLTEAAPRALPQDFAIAVMSVVLDGGIVVKALLIAGLFLACWGAGLLSRAVLAEAGLPGELVASTLAIWNPYVAERLLQGHWSLLVGYGCLPWVALTVIRLRSRPTQQRWGSWGALAFWTALAGLTPTGLMLAVTVAFACVAAPGAGVPRFRCLGGVFITGLCGAAPWLTAAALGSGLGTSPVSGLDVFSARAEPGLGTLGSLAGLGGIWNSEAVPVSRTSLFALLGTAVLLLVVGLGVRTAARVPATRPLLVLSVAGVLIPAAMASGVGLSLLREIVDAAPGLGVLRDGQKWVALAVPGYSLAGAAAVLALRRWIRPEAMAAVCLIGLIAVLPDLVWGVGGQINSVRYPPGWAAVTGTVNATPGTVAVLPTDTMRRFGWAGSAPVLDPLPRWLRPTVLATGDLLIAGQTVPGEGARARTVQELLLAGAPPSSLAAAGVGWIVDERDSSGARGASARSVSGLPVAYRDSDIVLYHVGTANSVAPQDKRTVMVLAHLIWAALMAFGAIAALCARVQGARVQGARVQGARVQGARVQSGRVQSGRVQSGRGP